MTKDFNSGIIRSTPEEDSGVKVYTDWESVRIQAAIQFTSDFISSSIDTSGIPVSELAVRLADNLVKRLKERSINPAPEFKFKEGELVKVKIYPGSGYEIMNRKYTIKDKVAYFCKHLGWMFESELQRYDPNEPKEPTQ